MTAVILTDHAIERGWERLRLRRDPLERLAQRAHDEGTAHADTMGRLKRYVDALYFKRRTANNIRIYGHNVFLFNGQLLVTVHPLPNDLRKLADRLRHGNTEKADRPRSR